MSRSDEIAEALHEVRSQLSSETTLIVVTKTFPISDIEILYNLGERNFGENRDSEGSEKSLALPDDVFWHFQGSLQSNKLRSIVHWADFIHSLDDLGHARKIAELAKHEGKSQRIFIQINLDEEPSTRSGIAPSEFEGFLEVLLGLERIQIEGVMGIAPLGQDPEPGFAKLAELSTRLQEYLPNARSISAGMSGDFKVALRYGATHIRIGSSILGSR